MAQATSSTKTTAPKSALPKSIFAVEIPNHELLKLAYEVYLANGRRSTATTKTRGEVRGGGKKPWRQKGTGRARFGSSRNPIWRHGGIVFGPDGSENYTKNLSQRSKHVALRQALTLADKAGKIVLVNDIKTTGKTSEIADFLKTNKLDETRRVLIVTNDKTAELVRATNNVSSVLLRKATYLTVYHILNADKIVITSSGLKAIEEWLSKKGDK